MESLHERLEGLASAHVDLGEPFVGNGVAVDAVISCTITNRREQCSGVVDEEKRLRGVADALKMLEGKVEASIREATLEEWLANDLGDVLTEGLVRWNQS